MRYTLTLIALVGVTSACTPSPETTMALQQGDRLKALEQENNNLRAKLAVCGPVVGPEAPPIVGAAPGTISTATPDTASAPTTPTPKALVSVGLKANFSDGQLAECMELNCPVDVIPWLDEYKNVWSFEQVIKERRKLGRRDDCLWVFLHYLDWTASPRGVRRVGGAKAEQEDQYFTSSFSAISVKERQQCFAAAYERVLLRAVEWPGTFPPSGMCGESHSDCMTWPRFLVVSGFVQHLTTMGKKPEEVGTSAEKLKAAYKKGVAETFAAWKKEGGDFKNDLQYVLVSEILEPGREVYYTNVERPPHGLNQEELNVLRLAAGLSAEPAPKAEGVAEPAK